MVLQLGQHCMIVDICVFLTEPPEPVVLWHLELHTAGNWVYSISSKSIMYVTQLAKNNVFLEQTSIHLN